MKKILITLFVAVGLVTVTPTVFGALTYPWTATTTTPYVVYPAPFNGTLAGVQAPFFISTSTTATSTFANGINMSDGCFALDGVCIGGGTVSSGLQGQAAFYLTSGTTVTGTSSLVMDTTTGNIAIGETASPASTPKLTVSGDDSGTNGVIYAFNSNTSTGGAVIGETESGAYGALGYQSDNCGVLAISGTISLRAGCGTGFGLRVVGTSVFTGNADTPTLVIRPSVAQSENVLGVQNNAGTLSLFSVQPDGDVFFNQALAYVDSTGKYTGPNIQTTSVGATSTFAGSVAIGTSTSNSFLEVNGGFHTEEQTLSTSTSMSVNFCSLNTSNKLRMGVGSANITFTWTNYQACVGKQIDVTVQAPNIGVVASTTFTATVSTDYIWDGYLNPGNNTNIGSVDTFTFESITSTSTAMIRAYLKSSNP